MSNKNKIDEPCYKSCANYSPRETLSLEEFNNQLSLLENIHIKNKLQQLENKKKEITKAIVWEIGIIGTISSFYIGNITEIHKIPTMEFLFIVVLFICYVFLTEFEVRYYDYTDQKNILLSYIEQNNLIEIKKIILSPDKKKFDITKANIPCITLQLFIVSYILFIINIGTTEYIKILFNIETLFGITTNNQTEMLPNVNNQLISTFFHCIFSSITAITIIICIFKFCIFKLGKVFYNKIKYLIKIILKKYKAFSKSPR